MRPSICPLAKTKAPKGLTAGSRVEVRWTLVGIGETRNGLWISATLNGADVSSHGAKRPARLLSKVLLQPVLIFQRHIERFFGRCADCSLGLFAAMSL